MKNNWQRVKLGDICNVNNRVYSISENWNFANYLDTGNITKNIINEFLFINLKTDKLPSRARRKVKNGNIIYSTVRPNQEHYGYIVSQPKNLLVSTAFAVLDINPECADSKFIYYLITQTEYTNLLQSVAEQSTTAYPSIKPSDITSLEIIIPPLDEQKKIVGILSALDDKIELNNKINRNLEAQAQAIFKSWFIDFEPFGGSMPSKWHYGNFSEIINSIIGGDWGKDSPTEAYIKKTYCIRGADIPSVKMGNKGKIPFRYILDKNYQTKQLQINDIVVEISGGSPTQSTGRCVQITQALLDRYDSSLICTNFCRAIKPQENYSSFVYHYLQYLYNNNVFFLYENGTTGIKNLDLNSFLVKEQIIIPSIDDVVKFNQIVCDISNVIYANSSENEKLAQLRDTLLPKLMSSEIDVSDIAV